MPVPHFLFLSAAKKVMFSQLQRTRVLVSLSLAYMLVIQEQALLTILYLDGPFGPEMLLQRSRPLDNEAIKVIVGEGH